MVRNYRFKSLKIPIAKSINASFIVCLSLILLFAAMNEAKLFHTRTTVGKCTDIIQFIGPFAALLVGLLDTILKRKDHRKLLRSWTTMDELMAKDFNMSHVNQKFLQNFLIKITILHFFALASEARIVYGAQVVDFWFANWCLKWISFVFGRVVDSQLIFFIELLRSRCEAFNCLLQDSKRIEGCHVGETGVDRNGGGNQVHERQVWKFGADIGGFEFHLSHCGGLFCRVEAFDR
jgi:7tm Chemosensory receptor